MRDAHTVTWKIQERKDWIHSIAWRHSCNELHYISHCHFLAAAGLLLFTCRFHHVKRLNHHEQITR